jgi:CHAT domain-containing protein
MTPRASSRLSRAGTAALCLLALAAALAAAPAEPPARSQGGAEPARAPSEVKKLVRAGKYQEAEVLARERLAAVEAESGPDALATAEALDDLADAVARLGKGADPAARAIAVRALAIKEALLGPDDGRLALSIRTLAILTNQSGDPRTATALLERAAQISERALGPDDPEVALHLSLLGSFVGLAGDYLRSRSLQERALAISRKALGDGDLQVARLEGSLAATLGQMGDYQGARRLFHESIAIQEKAVGPDHPSVLVTLDNLVETMMLAGDFEAARPFAESALKRREAKLGPDHFQLAYSLGHMAQVEAMSGNQAAALSYFARTIAVREKAVGRDHPWVAESLCDLGMVRARFGEARGAREAFEEALAIQDRTLDPRHPDRARTVLELSKALLALGESAAAFQRGLEAARLDREHFRATAQGLSEGDALRFARERDGAIDVLVTLLTAARKGAIPSGGTARAWDELVRSRALVLDEMASRHRYVADQSGGDVAGRARALSAARTRLAGLVGRLPQSGPVEAYREQMVRAYEEKEAAERALAEASAPFRRQQARSRAGLAEVLASLPEGSALLAFARYQQRGRTDQEPVPSYAAFVAQAGRNDPSLVALGKAAEIDALVEAWQREAGADPRREGSAAAAEERYRAAGERLRRRIWDPVAPRLKQATMVLIVPDGTLSLVNLATLPLPGGRFLLEDGAVLHELSSERDIVPVYPPPEVKPGLLAVGGVDYDASPTVLAQSTLPGEAAPQLAADPPAGASRYRSPEAACPEVSRLRFAPLPSTAAEIDGIAALQARPGAAPAAGGVRRLSGAAADEATLKSASERYGTLHLATHAYIVGDRCGAGGGGGGAVPGNGRDRGSAAPTLPVLQNPLLLTGLALAGANQRTGAARDGGGEDGLLTAEEIASLELSGVRWAVLSACRSGLGTIRNGEGVLGLRRAFAIAGASTLIMSLWQVEDEATSAWMEALYRARSRPLSTAAAVRQAGLDLLELQRRAGRTTHPFNWGGFIAAGDWR